jgi:hypothetical protein
MPDLHTESTFLPMVPVSPQTADQLAEIAWLEGTTVSYIVRRAPTDGPGPWLPVLLAGNNPVARLG